MGTKQYPHASDSSNQPINSDTELHDPFCDSEDFEVMEISDDELDSLNSKLLANKTGISASSSTPNSVLEGAKTPSCSHYQCIASTGPAICLSGGTTGPASKLVPHASH